MTDTRFVRNRYVSATVALSLFVVGTVLLDALGATAPLTTTLAVGAVLVLALVGIRRRVGPA